MLSPSDAFYSMLAESVEDIAMGRYSEFSSVDELIEELDIKEAANAV